MAYSRCKHVKPKPGCKYCPTGEVDIDLVLAPPESAQDDDHGPGPA